MTPRRAVSVAAVVPTVAALVACGGGGGAAASTAAASTAAAAPGPDQPRDPRPRRLGPCAPGSHAVAFTSGGQPRKAWIHVPRGVPIQARLPMVVAFHFAAGTGRQMEAHVGLSRLADRGRFVVLYPSAAGADHFWRLNRARGPDDLAITRDLLDAVVGARCVDPRLLYATGISNGGGMAARVGCELSDRFAAIAPVAGGYSSLDPCRPDRPVAVLEIHGTADTVVPYEGRGARHAGSVRAYLRGWVARDRCPSTARRRRINRRVLRLDWSPCAAGTAVAHLRLSGTTHGWPGAHGRLPARNPSRVAADRAVWDFFRGRTLAPPG